MTGYYPPASGGGGGGGAYLPLAGGTMADNATIGFDNSSAVREAGAQGLEIECSVGYRWQWVAGRMILRQVNSGQIQRVLSIDGVTPGATDDFSDGFIVGTRWETQDGTIYECTDSTNDAAVWAAASGGGGGTSPGVIYVQTAANGGDDGGDGTMGAPYATAQVAFDATTESRSHIHFGPGTVADFGTIVVTADMEFAVHITGEGPVASSVSVTANGAAPTAATSQPGHAGKTLKLTSDKSIYFNLIQNIGGNGEVGATGSASTGSTGGVGGNGGNTYLRGLLGQSLTLKGGNGGNGGETEPPDDPQTYATGGAGGRPGPVTMINDCDFLNVLIDEGIGGWGQPEGARGMWDGNGFLRNVVFHNLDTPQTGYFTQIGSIHVNHSNGNPTSPPMAQIGGMNLNF